MTDNPPEWPSPHAALLQDWHTIWLSELQALAWDREFIEAWDAGGRRLQTLWAGWAALGTAPATPRAASADDGTAAAAALSRADATSRAAPADPASAARDAAIRRLAERLDAIERRLADGCSAAPGDRA